MERWLVKYVAAACAVFGLYLGGWLGVVLYAKIVPFFSSFLMFLAGLAIGLGGAWLAVEGCRRAIGPNARHASASSIFLYWAPVLLFLWLSQLALGWALKWLIPPAISNLALWGAAAVAVWVEEPDEVSSPKETAARRGRPRS